MIFRTEIPIKKQPHNQIDYHSKLLLLGSCFSENIGRKLSYYKFQSTVNPTGILFHPKAIEKLITNAINEKIYTEKNLFKCNELWHCFDTHSSLSSPDKNELITRLKTASYSTFQQLKEASHIVITLGTAWVYRFIETDCLVANCHKVPQKKFLKEILTVDEISESLESIVLLIKSINKKAQVIFTVSPVRHIKDGFVENQQSKSHLLSAIHNIVESRKKTHYFPSYEIMMDELRDYRFYAEDMIHPNQTAINYIWEKFHFSWISEETNTTMNTIDSIQKGLLHRPFNPNTEAHQLFLNNLVEKKTKIINIHPHIKF